jgi:2-haloacid dehalogenase
MVAAHAWDVNGARAAGPRAIWIRRLERRWPFPIPEPDGVASLVEAADKGASVTYQVV